jgi:hypothetical protein
VKPFSITSTSDTYTILPPAEHALDMTAVMADLQEGWIDFVEEGGFIVHQGTVRCVAYSYDPATVAKTGRPAGLFNPIGTRVLRMLTLREFDSPPVFGPLSLFFREGTESLQMTQVLSTITFTLFPASLTGEDEWANARIGCLDRLTEVVAASYAA